MQTINCVQLIVYIYCMHALWFIIQEDNIIVYTNVFLQESSWARRQETLEMNQEPSRQLVSLRRFEKITVPFGAKLTFQRSVLTIFTNTSYRKNIVKRRYTHACSSRVASRT